MAAALSPVAEAVFAVLQDATLQALTPGGWHDDLPRAPEFPCGYVDLRERDARGFGTGNLPAIELRTHALSAYGGLRQAQAIDARVVALLKDQPLTVTGFTMCDRIFYDETMLLADQEILGEKVHEVVSMFRLYVEA